MRLKASYLVLTVLSIVPAMILLFYMYPMVSFGIVKDLLVVVIFFLILDASLSLILAFIAGKVEKPSGQSGQKT